MPKISNFTKTDYFSLMKQFIILRFLPGNINIWITSQSVLLSIFLSKALDDALILQRFSLASDWHLKQKLHTLTQSRIKQIKVEFVFEQPDVFLIPLYSQGMVLQGSQPKIRSVYQDAFTLADSELQLFSLQQNENIDNLAYF